jgi:hypothetical protein
VIDKIAEDQLNQKVLLLVLVYINISDEQPIFVKEAKIVNPSYSYVYVDINRTVRTNAVLENINRTFL